MEQQTSHIIIGDEKIPRVFRDKSNVPGCSPKAVMVLYRNGDGEFFYGEESEGSCPAYYRVTPAIAARLLFRAGASLDDYTKVFANRTTATFYYYNCVSRCAS